MANNKNYTINFGSLEVSQVSMSASMSEGYYTVTAVTNSSDSVAGLVESLSSGSFTGGESLIVTAGGGTILELSNLAIYRMLPTETSSGYSVTMYMMHSDIIKLISYPGFYMGWGKMTLEAVIRGILTMSGSTIPTSFEIGANVLFAAPPKFVGNTLWEMIKSAAAVHGGRVFFDGSVLKIYDPAGSDAAASMGNVLGKIHLTESSMSIDGLAAI